MDNSHKHSNLENEKNSVHSHAASNPKHVRVSISSPNEFELLELCQKDVRERVNLLDLDLPQTSTMTLVQTPLAAMPAVTIPNAISIMINNNGSTVSTGLTSTTNSNLNRSCSTSRSRTADCAQLLESNDISLLVNLEMDGAIQNNTHSSLNTNTNSNKGKGNFPSDSEQKHRLFQDPKILLQTNTYSSSSEISSENCINPPRVNCPEKIVICLDLNEEMNTTTFRSRAGDKYTGLELAKRAIKMFVMHKTQMNPKHEFAFLIFHQDSTMIQSFTPRAEDILNTLDESVIETQKSGPLDLSQLFSTIKENVTLPVVEGDPQAITPPFTVRVLLVFGRSHTVPVVSSTEAQKELESSPYFFTDVLYIHEPPTEENKCEEIFHKLCELDHRGLSYIFEQSKYTPILNSGAKLLAHPLQRPRQLDAMYKIGLPVSAIQIPTPHALVEDKI